MSSSLDTLIILGTQAQTFLINVASHGLALESQFSDFLPFGYPPYLRFFTNIRIRPFGGVQLVEAAYLIGTFAIIFSLPLVILPHPSSGKKITWSGLAQRAIVILGITWAMIVFVSEAGEMIGSGRDRNADKGLESLDEYGF